MILCELPPHSHRDAQRLRGNVEAGLRLLIKMADEHDKPLFRRAAEVGMDDLERLADLAGGHHAALTWESTDKTDRSQADG